MALKAGLHAQLVRAVCTIPALQADLLPHLISFLGAYSWSNAGQAAWLASLIPDLVDAVQSVEDSPGGKICKQQLLVLILPLLLLLHQWGFVLACSCRCCCCCCCNENLCSIAAAAAAMEHCA